MKIIMLDAGHGGHDPGAVGFGLEEKNVCLNAVLKVKQYLLANFSDVKVLTTRGDDTFIDLEERANMANEAKVDFFISFHNNAFNGQARGFESFVSTNASAASKAYQNMIHAKVVQAIGGASPDRGNKNANYLVLRKTKMPAILLEQLFIDSQADNKLIRDSKFHEKYCTAVAEGIAQCLGLTRKERDLTVGASEWAKKSWEKAIKLEVTDGSNPQSPLTREQLAVILDRLGLLK